MPQPAKHSDHAARQAQYRARQAEARQVELTGKGLPPLPAISSFPGWPRWNASFRAAQELIARNLSEMQDYYDDRSESWQESERGEDHQERIAAAEEAVDVVGGLIR